MPRTKDQVSGNPTFRAPKQREFNLPLLKLSIEVTVDTQSAGPIQIIPTPEEIRKLHEEGVRMMGITMPHALRQMQAMYQRTPDQTHARFVHYTTAEAALNIIRTKRFWLRNTNCMSDYREVQHGFDIFNRYFLDGAASMRPSLSQPSLS